MQIFLCFGYRMFKAERNSLTNELYKKLGALMVENGFRVNYIKHGDLKIVVAKSIGL